MITICFTYFRSLTLANLRAALYSVRRQDFSRVNSLVVLDNNTDDSVESINRECEALEFPLPVQLHSYKHGDKTKTHSWSTNVAVSKAVTPWILFTRADYLLAFETVQRFTEVVDARPAGWNGFVTSNCYQLLIDVASCETSDWRTQGVELLRRAPGNEIDYTCIDTGVWMARKQAFDEVGGLDEGLTAWGHAQTHFQYKLFQSGVDCVRIPEPLYLHTQHGAERDLGLAHQQLRDQGINLRELWERYHGVKFY